MVESKGEVFRIYKRLKFKKGILGISKLVFSIECDICLTNLQYLLIKFHKKLAILCRVWYNLEVTMR